MSEFRVHPGFGAETRAGRGGADFAGFVGFCGGLRFIILMAEGRSFGGAAEGAKGAAKVMHFPQT